MICGDVLTKRYKNPLKYNWNDTQWLIDNKLKAFHCPISAHNFRQGVNNLLQSNGLGEECIYVVKHDHSTINRAGRNKNLFCDYKTIMHIITTRCFYI